MEMRKGNRGVLLTLVTIVLLVVMTAELITYVYLTINYESVSSAIVLSSAGYRFAGGLDSATAGFLHESLYAALNALAAYESPASRQFSRPINNSEYVLSLLISNGLIYNTGANGLIDSANLISYTSSIEEEAMAQGLGLSITNATLQVYQTGPYTLNATYTALAIINSSSGSFTYPVSATSGISLNDMPELYSIQDNNNYNIEPAGAYPVAQLVANTYAIAGSRAPFQFVYGTVIIENGIAGCSSIPSQFLNSRYILAIPYDTVGSCGMGGVITYGSYGAYNVPYLVYNSAQNAIGYINNGTSLLLDGSALSLLNISQVDSSLKGGLYFRSSFAPSYLDLAQDNVSERSQYGLFSFNLYDRMVPLFSSTSQSYMEPLNGWLWMANAIQPFSISVWVDPSSGSGVVVDEQAPASLWHNSVIEIVDGVVYMRVSASSCLSLMQIPLNRWSNIAMTYDGRTFAGYVDGVLAASEQSARGVPAGSSQMYYPLGAADSVNCGSGASYSGSMANYQFYNTTLSPLQVSGLYYGGIDSLAARNMTNLDGWWPLNGNGSDYSGNGNLAIPYNSIVYKYMYGYTGDPVYWGSFYNGNLTNEVEGLAGCLNINKCSNSSVQHLYLTQASVESVQGSSVTEAGSLGLGNATIPNVMSFVGNSFVEPSNGFYWMDNSAQPFSMSVWIDPSSGNGVVLDEQSSGQHDSIIDMSNGKLLVSLDGLGCLDLGPVSLDNWSDVAITYDGGTTLSGYVDGSLASTENGGRIVPGSAGGTPMSYVLGSGDTTNCGSGAYYTGLMSNYQVYDWVLGSAQVLQIYQNGTVGTVSLPDGNTVIPDIADWTLANGYNGLTNQTINAANLSNPGLLGVNGMICTNANVIDGTCGLDFAQP